MQSVNVEGLSEMSLKTNVDEYWVECFAPNEALKLMAHGFQI